MYLLFLERRNMPARGAEVEAVYQVTRGGQVSNGRQLSVCVDGDTIRQIDVYPQAMRLQDLSGLDTGIITLFITVENGQIITYRFEKRSNV